MNVWGSGGAHKTYFNKIDKIILNLFNKPINEQPKGVVDVGCGDGTFLKHVYTIIKNRTLRGKHLNEHPLDIIGVDIEAIHITEDREQFRKLMDKIDIPVAPARIATSFLEGKEIAQELGFPLVIRPSFTLGGSGASFVHTKEEFEDLLSKSPRTQTQDIHSTP